MFGRPFAPACFALASFALATRCELGSAVSARQDASARQAAIVSAAYRFIWGLPLEVGRRQRARRVLEDHGIALTRPWESVRRPSGPVGTLRPMFPPEMGPERDHRSPGRVHRIGRRGRPLSLVAAVGLFGIFWAASAGMALWGVVHGPATDKNGSVAFTVLMFVSPPGGSAVESVAYLLPGLIAGGALLTAGFLLRRREVSEWGGF